MSGKWWMDVMFPGTDPKRQSRWWYSSSCPKTVMHVSPLHLTKGVSALHWGELTGPSSSHPYQPQVGLGCREASSYFRSKKPLVLLFSQGVYHLHISTMVMITKRIRNSLHSDRKCPTAVSLATLSLELTLYSVHPWEPGAIQPPVVKVPKALFHLKGTQLLTTPRVLALFLVFILFCFP